MTPQEKARETRRKNQEAQTAMWREKREAIKTAKAAIVRAMDSKELTPSETIQAAQLLVEISKM